jgi:hypothetical protein
VWFLVFGLGEHENRKATEWLSLGGLSSPTTRRRLHLTQFLSRTFAGNLRQSSSHAHMSIAFQRANPLTQGEFKGRCI